VFFFEEVADNSWLILSPPDVCSGVGHHVRLIAGPLPAHGLLGVLVEQLVWVELGAVPGHEAEFQCRLPRPVGCDPAGHLRSPVGRVRVDDEDDFPAVGGFQEPGEEAIETSALKRHERTMSQRRPRLLMAEIMLHPNRRPVAGTIGVCPRGA